MTCGQGTFLEAGAIAEKSEFKADQKRRDGRAKTPFENFPFLSFPLSTSPLFSRIRYRKQTFVQSRARNVSGWKIDRGIGARIQIDPL